MAARIASIDAERQAGRRDRWFRLSDETCTNVSRGGALLVSPEPLAPGRRLLVELDLPDGDSLQAVGRVAWSRIAPAGKECAFDSGIEFVEASPEHWAKLQAFLDDRDPKD